jgi:hypothetical protein
MDGGHYSRIALRSGHGGRADTVGANMTRRSFGHRIRRGQPVRIWAVLRTGADRHGLATFALTNLVTGRKDALVMMSWMYPSSSAPAWLVCRHRRW